MKRCKLHANGNRAAISLHSTHDAPASRGSRQWDGGCGEVRFALGWRPAMAGRRAGRTAQKKRTARLKQQRPAAAAWTENKMRVLSTELILERLAGLGIATSVDEIVQQARVEHAASAIAEGWRERLPVSPHRVDDDSLTSPRVCCGNGSFRSVAVSSSWPVS